ncbi:hypothetical protein GCM10027416_10550 [Okibacterium endophyticum]
MNDKQVEQSVPIGGIDERITMSVGGPVRPVPDGDDALPALTQMRVLASSMSAVLDRCVWSQTMSHRSLVTYLVEECYELVDAIETGDIAVMLEELGDVLLQVVFHAEIARRTAGEDFDLDDVARATNEKLVRRHPHVFDGEDAPTVEDVLRLWSAAKASEKSERRSVLDGVPQGLPALVLADKIIGRAGRAGIDLRPDPHVAGLADVTDEAELGRHLFDLVAAARRRGLDPERALRAHLRAVQDDVRAAE